MARRWMVRYVTYPHEKVILVTPVEIPAAMPLASALRDAMRHMDPGPPLEEVRRISVIIPEGRSQRRTDIPLAFGPDQEQE